MPNPESAAVRDLVALYTQGSGIDIGCGRETVTPDAVGIDFPQEYNRGAQTAATIQGPWQDILKTLSGLDFVFSSHLLEEYPDTSEVLVRWVSVLRPGGFLILNLPIESKYLPYCTAHGIEPNRGHTIHWEGPDDFHSRFSGWLAEQLTLVVSGMVEPYSFFVVYQFGDGSQ